MGLKTEEKVWRFVILGVVLVCVPVNLLGLDVTRMCLDEFGMEASKDFTSTYVTFFFIVVTLGLIAYFYKLYYEVSYTFTWYYISLAQVNTLKEFIGDFRCSKHPNSVSGHSNYFFFALLSSMYLIRMVYEKNEEFSIKDIKEFLRKLSILVVYSLFIVSGIEMLYETLFYGYHTPEQLIYGTGLALINIYIFRKSNFVLPWLICYGVIFLGNYCLVGLSHILASKFVFLIIPSILMIVTSSIRLMKEKAVE